MTPILVQVNNITTRRQQIDGPEVGIEWLERNDAKGCEIEDMSKGRESRLTQEGRVIDRNACPTRTHMLPTHLRDYVCHASASQDLWEFPHKFQRFIPKISDPFKII